MTNSTQDRTATPKELAEISLSDVLIRGTRLDKINETSRGIYKSKYVFTGIGLFAYPIITYTMGTLFELWHIWLCFGMIPIVVLYIKIKRLQATLITFLDNPYAHLSDGLTESLVKQWQCNHKHDNETR